MTDLVKNKTYDDIKCICDHWCKNEQGKWMYVAICIVSGVPMLFIDGMRK